jgi:hypothetical protein
MLTQVRQNGREDNIKTVNEINVNEKLVTVIYYINEPSLRYCPHIDIQKYE